MKKFLLFAVVLMSLSFIACSDETVIDPKRESAVDFLELYEKDAEYVRHALKKYIIDENGIDENGENYWTIRQKNSKNSIYVICDGDEAFISFTMKNNICTRVSLLYHDTYHSIALRYIQDRYWEGNQLDYNWYNWSLDDGSIISYFGIQSYTYKTLHIYREKEEIEYLPMKKLTQTIEFANIQ